MENVQIIYSKLIPPIPSVTYMRRSRFIKKMNQASAYRLTIVEGGAGFGKSLGLAQYVKDSRSVNSWYTVTEEDDNVIPFLAYVQKSIQRVVPNFGEKNEQLTLPTTFLRTDDLEQWVALFINELCQLSDALTIIIDDFHLVDHVFHINLVMEKIIQLLPPHVHIIISSRTRPKWPSLLKWKMNEQLLEITREDLTFSKEEIVVYLEDYFHLEVDEKRVQEIFQMTEGWAIAINLLALQFSETGMILSNTLELVYKNLFDYLSEEVYQGRTKEEQEWLRYFSIFPIFTTDLIADFYGEKAVEALQQLAAGLSFIQSLEGDKTFRFHGLFQQFLKEKWLQTDPETFQKLHKKATAYYDHKENYVQATFHAVESEDQNFIGKVLSETAMPLIRSGQFDWFLDIFQQLDDRVRTNYYVLYYYEGEVHRYRAFYEQARKAYLRCLLHAEEFSDAYLLSRTYAGLAHIFLDTIQPALAESYLKQAIDWSQKTEQMQEKEKAMLKRQFAENLVNLGRAHDAENWVKKERLSATILREGNLEARILLRMGKLTEAQQVLEAQAIRTNLPDSHRETEVLLSLIYSLIGEVETALYYAESGIATGKKVKSAFIEAVGFTRAAHAEMLRNPFHLDEAERLYATAIEMMKQLNVTRGIAEPSMGLAVVKARQGNFVEAISYSRAALHETEKVNDQWMSGLIQLSLTVIYFYQNDLANARGHAEEAIRLFGIGGDKYGEMVGLFWWLNIVDPVAEQDLFHTQSLRFLQLISEGDYFFYLEKDTLFGPFDREIVHPLLAKIATLHQDRQEVKLLRERIDIKDNHVGYRLYVKVFGQVHVLLGMNSVPEHSWKRGKAKELLLYLLLHRDRFLSKEEMMQALWDDVDEKTADRNFKVTLNALLKVLEPKRVARQVSFFILRKNTMYRLNPQAKVITDFELFLDGAEKGLQTAETKQSLKVLLKAASFYEGVAFEEFRHIDWLMRKQEQLENKYMQVVERIAQHNVTLGNDQQVIRWAEKLLVLDSTWEEAYRLLMQSYYRLQNRPQAMKWYNKCVEVLEKELSIRPMEKTKQIYEMIVNDGEME